MTEYSHWNIWINILEIIWENQRITRWHMNWNMCWQEKDRIKENLESVIKRLLFVREAANITHILGDGDKRAKTLGMAEALAGFTGNLAVVRLVQTGVIAAWAYVESILDIRALLAGDKIALIKLRRSGQRSLAVLRRRLKTAKRQKTCENGVSYQGYLKGFL